MSKQHVGQTIRTRSFKAGNERIETGVLVKSQKGRNVSVEEQCENAVSERRTDSVLEETLVVSTTGLILVKEHNHPLLLQERRHRQTEESLTKVAVREVRVLQD